MTKVVHLNTYRTKAIEQRAFAPWYKRFGELYGPKARVSDLSAATLYFLACPGEESALAYYEFIMGIQSKGPAVKFYYLNKNEQVTIMDIHLFLADQVRFEMMRRLNWLDRFPGESYTLLEMVLNFDRIKVGCSATSLELAQTHPEYSSFTGLVHGDKEVFVRRLLPQALETFKDLLDKEK
jgi:hypothetical protein